MFDILLSLHDSVPNQDIYSINNNSISFSSHHKDPGVIMSSDLTWTKYYHLIMSKAYKSLG